MVWTYLSSVQLEVEERTKASNYRFQFFPIVSVGGLTSVNNFIVGACSISGLADHPFLPTVTPDALPSGV
jgi:hypothetical protein